MARPAPARTAISPAPKSQLARVIVPDAKLRAIFENFNRARTAVTMSGTIAEIFKTHTW